MLSPSETISTMLTNSSRKDATEVSHLPLIQYFQMSWRHGPFRSPEIYHRRCDNIRLKPTWTCSPCIALVPHRSGYKDSIHSSRPISGLDIPFESGILSPYLLPCSDGSCNQTLEFSIIKTLSRCIRQCMSRMRLVLQFRAVSVFQHSFNLISTRSTNQRLPNKQTSWTKSFRRVD